MYPAPEKGLYIITAQGKKALGIPEVTKEKATPILAYAPHDKVIQLLQATVDATPEYACT